MEVSIIEYDPSQQLVNSFPEFKDIRIYGTAEEPLFTVSDVHSLVGVVDKRELEKNGYKRGEHWTKLTIKTDRRLVETNMFTERGLYRFLNRHDTPICQKFEEFVYILVNEVRKKGKVTLETATKRLQEELATTERELDKKKRFITNLNEQVEEKHYKVVDLEERLRIVNNRNLRKFNEAEALRMQLKQTEYGQRSSDAEIELQRFKEHCMAPLYVYLSKPPPELREMIAVDYELLDETPNDDDMYVFELGLRKSELDKNQVALHYVYKFTKLIDIQNYLIKEGGMGVKNSRGQYYTNRYFTNLDNLNSYLKEFLYTR